MNILMAEEFRETHEEFLFECQGLFRGPSGIHDLCKTKFGYEQIRSLWSIRHGGNL